jgi:hypothetical protein
VTDGNGTKRKQLDSIYTQMTYNVMEDISKLRISLNFTEVVKTPPAKTKHFEVVG